MRIVGVSFDPPDKNARWAEEKGYHFELWSDTSRELAMACGAAHKADQARADRVTVLIDPQGRLVVRYEPGLGLGTHPADVLEDAKILFPAK